MSEYPLSAPLPGAEPPPEPAPPWRLHLTRRDWLALVLLTLLALGLRAWRLDFPQAIYFDEQYYAKASGDYLDGRQDSNTVHPPLAKLQIAAARLVFDGLKGYGWVTLPDSVGWRLGSLLAGTATVPLTYLLGMVLSYGRRRVAVIAALLVALDFLSLASSRICMLDPFVSLWILAGMLMAARYAFEEHRFDWAVMAALAFGVATACKWNGLFAAAGAGLCMMELRVPQTEGQAPRLRYGLPFLFATAIVALYLLAYVPFFLKEGSFGPEARAKVVGYHQTMVNFRFNAKKFKHQYLSQFYEWPLILRPIWYYYKETGKKPDKVVYGIAAIGSPVVWWTAAFFMLEALVTALRLRHPVAQFLVANYLANWACWAGSTTGGFFYYMLPLVPLMGLIVALCLDSWGEGRTARRLRVAFLVVVVVSFVLYYPLLTGIPVSDRYFRGLFFIPAWI